MKKIIMFFMALCMVLPALNAQNNKALNKALKKEYKVKMKEFKKGIMMKKFLKNLMQKKILEWAMLRFLTSRNNLSM